MQHSRTLIDVNNYEKQHIAIASQKELRSISGNINLNHMHYVAILISKYSVDLIVIDTRI